MEGEAWFPFASEYDPLECGSIDRTDTEPHDRAIIRAINSRYKPDPTLINDPTKTLFIARLNFNSTEDEVKDYFKYYGKIKSCRIVRDIVTGYSKGYGFVEYENESDCLRAKNQANKHILDGKEIFVDAEIERKMPGWKPRRLGGGFGGKRESGQLRFGGRDRPFKRPYDMYNEQSEERNYSSNRYGRDFRDSDNRRDNRNDRSSKYRQNTSSTRMRHSHSKTDSNARSGEHKIRKPHTERKGRY